MQEERPKRTYDLEGLMELIVSLQEASSQGVAIIVEGKRDEQALRALGLPGPVIKASHRSALDLAEEAARSYKEIIMLTDWDDKGEEMARNIERLLRSVGARADLETRNRLKKLVKKEIKDVESLYLYVERMMELYGDKNCSNRAAWHRQVHCGTEGGGQGVPGGRRPGQG